MVRDQPLPLCSPYDKDAVKEEVWEDEIEDQNEWNRL